MESSLCRVLKKGGHPVNYESGQRARNGGAYSFSREGADIDMWYVIQVQTGREEQILEEARRYQVQEYYDEIFVPHYERRRKYLGQWHTETELLFPGYLFVISSAPEKLYKALKRIPQLTKLLGTGEKWTSMSDEDIESIGAGDQGIMFGFATNETEEYMPLPISLAHKLSYRLTEVRKNGTLPYLRPDGKTQVTVEYDEFGKPLSIDTVLLSTQHSPDIEYEQIVADIKKYVFDAVLPQELLTENTRYLVNPTGRFVIGGPHGDAGLTGRKIIVDTYGGYARHGGGAFSGKDATKVDRSAAYAARYVAKNLVAAGYADKMEIQLSYAIGVAQPTSIMVDTFGTGKVSEDKIVKVIRDNFDLRPAGIIQMLDLRKPVYKKTAAYGHFGRTDVDLTWERLDKVDELKVLLEEMKGE